MSFLSGFPSIFSTEDERARQDREQKQRQRLALQDAAHFRQQAEQITLPFQAEVFRREADAKIKGLELRLNQDKAKKEGMAFRQFADQTVAKKLGGLFGGQGAKTRPMPQDFGAQPDYEGAPKEGYGFGLPPEVAKPLGQGLQAGMNTRIGQLAPFGPGTYVNQSERPTIGQVAEQNLLKVPGVESGIQQLPEPLREGARTTAI